MSKHNTLTFRAVVLLLAFFVAMPSMAAEFYISPDGDDNNSGSESCPLATLAGARDAVRELKAKGRLCEPVNVFIANGSYTLVEPVIFEAQDSGSKDHPVVYQAADGARPVFTGGRLIGGFKRGKDGIWQAKIPDVKKGDWYFDQLFVNGRRVVRARTPNKWYHYMSGKVEDGVDPETNKKIVEPVA